MSTETPGPLLRSVDRAAFAVGLGERLRRAGVPVTFTALGAFTEALGCPRPPTCPRSTGPPGSRSWTTSPTFPRSTRCSRPCSATPPAPRRGRPPARARTTSTTCWPRSPRHPPRRPSGLPWHTLPHVVGTDDRSPGRRRHARRSRAAAECAGEPRGHAVRRAGRRAARADRGVAGAGLAPLADPPEPPAPGAPVRAGGGAAGDDRGVPAHRVGAPGAEPDPGCAATTTPDPGRRRQPVHAAVRRGVPAPDAGPGAHRAGRDLRVLHLADPVDAGAAAPFRHGGDAAGHGAGRRPVRRHPSGVQPRRAARVAARERPARRRPGRGVGRLGQ